MLESTDTFSSCGKVREDFLEEVVFSDREDSSAKVQKQERTCQIMEISNLAQWE